MQKIILKFKKYIRNLLDFRLKIEDILIFVFLI